MICISGAYWMTGIEQEVIEVSMSMVVVLRDTDTKVIWRCFSLAGYWRDFILATCIEKQN